MRAHFVFEKFTEDSDPIDDLKIGVRHQIIKFLEENGDYNQKKYFRAHNRYINDEELLLYCAKYNKIDWCEYLLLKGINDKNALTAAAQWARYNSNKKLYNMLIDAGADKDGIITINVIHPKKLT